LPHALSFVILGRSFESPRSWALFAVLMLACLVIAVLLHRSKWAKKHLLNKAVEPEL